MTALEEHAIRKTLARMSVKRYDCSGKNDIVRVSAVAMMTQMRAALRNVDIQEIDEPYRPLIFGRQQ